MTCVCTGKMGAGIAQENLAEQNITFSVNPGEVFIAPQGLLHYNHNQECEPLAFLQFFNSNDAAALNVIGALAMFTKNPDGTASMIASTANQVQASPQMAFALDQQCLARCGLPATGAEDGFAGMPKDIAVLFGR